MTFQQLADSIPLDLIDLCGDFEFADTMADEQLYHCPFLDDLVTEGLLTPDLKIA